MPNILRQVCAVPLFAMWKFVFVVPKKLLKWRLEHPEVEFLFIISIILNFSAIDDFWSQTLIL